MKKLVLNRDVIRGLQAATLATGPVAGQPLEGMGPGNPGVTRTIGMGPGNPGVLRTVGMGPGNPGVTRTIGMGPGNPGFWAGALTG